MATVDSNFFEIQRRAFIWSQTSTLDDGSTSLGWDDDPNTIVNGNTPGETKLYSVLVGALYIESTGRLWLKQALPNVWVEFQVTQAVFADKVADSFDCDVGVVVGDVVRASTTIADKVIPLTSNVYDNLAFGVVISKPTTTTCEVLVSGKITGLTGLTFGKPMFVNTDGSLTTTKPASGHLQKMGIAIKSDTGFLLPSMEKVIQT